MGVLKQYIVLNWVVGYLFMHLTISQLKFFQLLVKWYMMNHEPWHVCRTYGILSFGSRESVLPTFPNTCRPKLKNTIGALPSLPWTLPNSTSITDTDKFFYYNFFDFSIAKVVFSLLTKLMNCIVPYTKHEENE